MLTGPHPGLLVAHPVIAIGSTTESRFTEVEFGAVGIGGVKAKGAFCTVPMVWLPPPKEHCQVRLLVTVMLVIGAFEGAVMVARSRIDIPLGIFDLLTSAALRSIAFVVVLGGGDPI
jgi:hypothetical protein